MIDNLRRAPKAEKDSRERFETNALGKTARKQELEEDTR